MLSLSTTRKEKFRASEGQSNTSRVEFSKSIREYRHTKPHSYWWPLVETTGIGQVNIHMKQENRAGIDLSFLLYLLSPKAGLTVPEQLQFNG